MTFPRLSKYCLFNLFEKAQARSSSSCSRQQHEAHPKRSYAWSISNIKHLGSCSLEQPSPPPLIVFGITCLGCFFALGITIMNAFQYTSKNQEVNYTWKSSMAALTFPCSSFSIANSLLAFLLLNQTFTMKFH